jgi:hypothetical protein
VVGDYEDNAEILRKKHRDGFPAWIKKGVETEFSTRAWRKNSISRNSRARSTFAATNFCLRGTFDAAQPLRDQR